MSVTLLNAPHLNFFHLFSQTHKQSNKPIMEKRRRARINNCLNELKALILDATKKDVSIYLCKTTMTTIVVSVMVWICGWLNYESYILTMQFRCTNPINCTHTARSTLETGKSRYSGENCSLLARHATPTVGYRTGRRSECSQ